MNTTEKLNIALFQTDIIWENPKANKDKIDLLIKKLDTSKIDLIILPEMFTTGFTTNTLVAETMEGSTLKWLQNICNEQNIAIMGSLIIKEKNNYFNRLVCITPFTKPSFYDKRHTFKLAKEHKTISAGSYKEIITYKGWKICPLVCYDLRFPVWSRNTENYDLLIYVASWPEIRIETWKTLLKARAIENMSYTIGVNRVGKDINNFNYNGQSLVFNTLGKLINTESDKEEVITVTLDKNEQNNLRTKLNFLADIDNFNLI